MEMLKADAESGEADAQHSLAVAYNNGFRLNGVELERNRLLAARWYRAAAEQMHSESQKNLGVMYMTGMGVAEDFTEAQKWLYAYSLNGNTEADKALKLLEQAAAPSQRAEGTRRALKFIVAENVIKQISVE
jgi:TPR repeat protein